MSVSHVAIDTDYTLFWTGSHFADSRPDAWLINRTPFDGASSGGHWFYRNASRIECRFYNYKTNTNHFCTYFNTFLTMIPNFSHQKFQNVNICDFLFVIFCWTCCLLESVITANDLVMLNVFGLLEIQRLFRNYQTNTRHVCTYLNEFFTLTLNIG